MSDDRNEADDAENPVLVKVQEKDTTSMIAVAGHPLHAMSVHFPIALVFATLAADVFYWWSADAFWLRAGLWTSGAAFLTGLAAGAIGTVELLLVAGIRARVASWAHGVAALTMLSIAGLNWGLRLQNPDVVLPHGLLVSLLATGMTVLAGWHGGKLIFHHGVGLMVSPKG